MRKRCQPVPEHAEHQDVQASTTEVIVMIMGTQIAPEDETHEKEEDFD